MNVMNNLTRYYHFRNSGIIVITIKILVFIAELNIVLWTYKRQKRAAHSNSRLRYYVCEQFNKIELRINTILIRLEKKASTNNDIFTHFYFVKNKCLYDSLKNIYFYHIENCFQKYLLIYLTFFV